MGLGLQLVPHEVLDILGFERRGQEAFPEFLEPVTSGGGATYCSREVAYLNVAQHILLDGREGNRAKEVFRPSC